MNVYSKLKRGKGAKIRRSAGNPAIFGSVIALSFILVVSLIKFIPRLFRNKE